MLAPFESAVDEETVAVFERTVVAGAVTVTLMVRVTDPADGRVAMDAVTVSFVPGFPLQVPRVGVQEINVVPAGSGSLMTTLFAVPGPLFVTLIV